MMKILPLALLLLAAAAPQEARKPNIVFIHADDLGYGDLSCYGRRTSKRPTWTKWRRKGLRFTQYYAGNTVCAPSRCALMTGYHMGHSYIRGTPTSLCGRKMSRSPSC